MVADFSTEVTETAENNRTPAENCSVNQLLIGCGV
jgi:hypothetical protein